MKKRIMEDPFSILAPFLKRMEGEVAGRTTQEPDETSKVLLRKLAVGDCPESEVEEVVALLKLNPGWVPYLAHYVKEMRG